MGSYPLLKAAYTCLKHSPLTLVLLFSLCPGEHGRASVTDSHHDIAIFGDEFGAGCLLCHDSFNSVDDSTRYNASEIDPATGLGPIGTFCLTCHDGTVKQNAMIPGPWLGGVICNGCHGTGPQTQEINWHHPTGETDYFTKIGFPEFLPWSLGPGMPGDLRDGMQCVDCHTGLARNAHNW